MDNFKVTAPMGEIIELSNQEDLIPFNGQMGESNQINQSRWKHPRNGVRGVDARTLEVANAILKSVLRVSM